MATKKYLVFGGNLVNQDTLKERYMTAEQVAKKYNLNPDDCLLVDIEPEGDEIAVLQSRNINRYAHVNLRPQFDGNYKLEEVEASQQV